MTQQKNKQPNEGKNITAWFPDAEVAEDLSQLASEINTSTSAIIFELVTKCIPAIRKGKRLREISLDGVKISV